MVDLIRTLPVYRRVVQYAYAERHDWSGIRSLNSSDRTFAEDHIARVDLGPRTGKTSVAVDIASMWSDVIIIAARQSLANNITRRNKGVRAFGPDDLAVTPATRFDSTQPLFIFDDVPQDDTLDILVKFRPERFVHFGRWA